MGGEHVLKPAVAKGAFKPISSPSPTIEDGVQIGHVHLKSRDLSLIESFYVGVLGFEVVAKMRGALFLSAGGYHHHLAFNTWESAEGSPPPPSATGLYHVAIRYPSRVALANALARLVCAKWRLDGVSDHGTHIAIYLRDPEQNGLELEWDRPNEEWPLDEDGHLAFVSDRLDLQALLDEATI